MGDGSDGQGMGVADGPLQGIRILDMSRILAGPFATQLLGDLGADVIKVEKPGAGDDTRSWGPPYVADADGTESRESAYYLAANRNKRSFAADIASPEGQAEIRVLARVSDVVIENFKRGGLAKYGLDHAALRAENPRLVHCSITGYGQTGPNADLPGYDLMAQGYAGIMAITGEVDGMPMKVGIGIADVMCGMYAANAIQAALRHRDRTGEGQHIDIGLVDSTISWLINAGTNHLMAGGDQRFGNQHPNIVPYQAFKVADGHVIVAAGNDGQFARLCALLDRPELAEDPEFATNPARLANRARLVALLADEMAAWQKSPLLARLADAKVPGGPINTLEDVFASDQAAARDMVIRMDHPAAGQEGVRLLGNPLKLSVTPVTYRRPPPVCGEHTEEIRRELLGKE